MVRKKKAPKKKEAEVSLADRTCLRCKFAYLMRSMECNPIVSECGKTKMRHVASTPHAENCGFKERDGEMEIHEMIFLNK